MTGEERRQRNTLTIELIWCFLLILRSFLLKLFASSMIRWLPIRTSTQLLCSSKSLRILCFNYSAFLPFCSATFWRQIFNSYPTTCIWHLFKNLSYELLQITGTFCITVFTQLVNKVGLWASITMRDPQNSGNNWAARVKTSFICFHQKIHISITDYSAITKLSCQTSNQNHVKQSHHSWLLSNGINEQYVNAEKCKFYKTT